VPTFEQFLDGRKLLHLIIIARSAPVCTRAPTGAIVRSPVAWVASVEETKRMKPTDKAILGVTGDRLTVRIMRQSNGNGEQQGT
jgi:hypothetical protein